VSKIDYESLKALAKELRRPASTLYALAHGNDPFYIGPQRTIQANWIAEIWHRLGISSGYHLRRIHYRLISQPDPILKPSGARYENTYDCWTELLTAVRDAIALDLIPDDTLVDRRNGEARLFQIEARDANIELYSYLPEYEQFGLPRLPRIDRPSLPWLGLDPPTVPQPYQVEIWAEKATIDDVLLPLAVRYKVNIQTGVGEVSATRCRDLVNRVEAHERPVRILLSATSILADSRCLSPSHARSNSNCIAASSSTLISRCGR
jgi:hypothetical protein